MLWSEEYRPSSFSDIVGNSDIIEEIQAEVESGDMNHMAFFGPAGVGKTTTALVIANTLYGSSSSGQFKELNASDERGINVIRDQVKRFAGKKTLSGRHKIIFLDEADNLTPDAQQALRRTMERYQNTCRFILTGNYESGLIDALKSRCSDYRFEPITVEESVPALKRIAEAEGLELPDAVYEKIAQIYAGDLRSQVNKLQQLSTMDEVDIDRLEAGEDYHRLLKLMLDRNYVAAKKVANERNLRRLYHYLLQRNDLRGRVKAQLSVTYSKYMWRIDKSVDKDIHLNALVGEVIKLLNGELE